MPTIRGRMQADLTAAMKARDRTAVAALRGALSAISNAEAIEVASHSALPVAGSTEAPRRELSEDDIRGLVQRERDEWNASAEEMRRLGRTAESEDLAAQAMILSGYL